MRVKYNEKNDTITIDGSGSVVLTLNNFGIEVDRVEKIEVVNNTFLVIPSMSIKQKYRTMKFLYLMIFKNKIDFSKLRG